MEPQTELSRVDVPVCLSLAAFFPCRLFPFQLQPSGPCECQTHLQMSALLSRLLRFAFLLPGFFSLSFCVFCKNWTLGNKMRCAYCMDVCEGGERENRLKINLVDGEKIIWCMDMQHPHNPAKTAPI